MAGASIGGACYLSQRNSFALNKGRCIKTANRLGTNELLLEKGRHLGLPRNQRTCPCCGHGVEDAFHFTMKCSAYRTERQRFFDAVEKIINESGEDIFNWRDQSLKERFAFLHSCGLDPKDDGAEAEYAQWRKIEVEFYKFSVAIKSRRKEIIKKLPPNSRYDPADLLSDRWGSMSK